MSRRSSRSRTYDPELAAGDWVWLNRAAALENANVALAATDLAFQAIASQEFLDFLVAVIKAAPE